MQTNWPKPDSIKIVTFWMIVLELLDEFCNLQLVLGDRLHLALFKKIGILHELSHLVTHNQFSKLPRSSSNLVEITVIFSKSAKCSLYPKSNDKLQNSFCNWNLLIKNVSILIESGFGQFFCIKVNSSTMCKCTIVLLIKIL